MCRCFITITVFCCFFPLRFRCYIHIAFSDSYTCTVLCLHTELLIFVWDFYECDYLPCVCASYFKSFIIFFCILTNPVRHYACFMYIDSPSMGSGIAKCMNVKFIIYMSEAIAFGLLTLITSLSFLYSVFFLGNYFGFSKIQFVI